MGITNIVIIVIDSGSYLKPFSRYPMNHVPHSYPSPRGYTLPCISAPMAKRSRSINIPKFTAWNMAETWYIIWYIIWLSSIPYWESLQCCLCISMYITIDGFIMSIPKNWVHHPTSSNSWFYIPWIFPLLSQLNPHSMGVESIYIAWP